MLGSLIHISVDFIYLCYWSLKNSIYGSIYVYNYLTDGNKIEISKSELDELNKRMIIQENMIKELKDVINKKNSLE